MPSPVNRTRWTTALVLMGCLCMLLAGYAMKARCAGPPFAADGRSIVFDQVKNRDVCYSDVQFLWSERGLGDHRFPYVHGSITRAGVLTGGTVEYPVLTGVVMWLSALPASTDADFLLVSALILAPFGLLTAWLLVGLAGRAAYLWAIGPPLALYAFHNWDLPVVAITVAAFYLVLAPPRESLRLRAVGAAVLLGVGTCLKLYPAIFVLPLLVYVLTGGPEGRDLPPGRRYDVRGAAAVGAAAVATVAAFNAPFAIAGFTGWRASFTFQELRPADITSNSVWYWGLRPLLGDGFADRFDITWNYVHIVDFASPAAVLASFAFALWLGERRRRVTGTYPWVGVCAAMLCGFLLCHKVFSPQYTLWILPFLVLIRMPWATVGAYLIADAMVGIGVFRFYYAIESGGDYRWLLWVVVVGVWVRTVLLGYFLWALVARDDLDDKELRETRAVPAGAAAVGVLAR